eukprot:symbB.v1.2.017877.t1/scaffold1334.1/size124731/11
MSYAAPLQARIAEIAEKEAPRRAENLENGLQEYFDVRARGQSYSSEVVARMGEELLYLERLLATLPDQVDLKAKVAGLRQRYDAIGACRGLQNSTQGGGSSGSQFQAETSCESVQHLATFLYPHKERCKAEDEVRVLSAQGGLFAELAQHPILTCVESDRTIILGSVERMVSWSEEDDAPELARRQLALLELSQAGANLVEFTHFMSQQLGQDQDEALDLIEQKVAEARETTREAVVTLSGTAAERDGRQLLWPAAGLMMLGGLVFFTCPAGAPLLCAAGRGALFVGATVSSMGTLSTLQKQIIQNIQEQLPRGFEKLPDEQAKTIREACEEANDRLGPKDRYQVPKFRYFRLQTRLDDGAWKEESFIARVKTFEFQALAREVGNDLVVKRGRSLVRNKGHAYLVTFTVDLPVSRAFRVMQQMSLVGSLDPGCKVMWSRPVDAASRRNTHYIRYVAFAEWFFSRDFCTACHCGPSRTATDEECYTMATRSMSAPLLEMEGLPKPSGEPAAFIDIVGVRLTEFAENALQTKVEVMADLDPAAPALYPTNIVDKRIRAHTRNAAWLLQRAFKDANVSGAVSSRR